MRRNFHIRRLNPLDTEEVADCIRSLTGKAGFDPSILSYPNTVILVAEDGKDKVYQPVQTCYFLETLGYHESISEHSLALAMKQFTSILMWEMAEKGIGEMYFLGSNDDTNAFALQNQFEEVNYKVFRLKRQRPQSSVNSEGSNADSHTDDVGH